MAADMDRVGVRQHVQGALGVADGVGTGNAQIGNGRVEAHNTTVIARQLVDEVSQAHLVRHQHALRPVAGGAVGDADLAEGAGRKIGALPGTDDQRCSLAIFCQIHLHSAFQDGKASA